MRYLTQNKVYRYKYDKGVKLIVRALQNYKALVIEENMSHRSVGETIEISMGDLIDENWIEVDYLSQDPNIWLELENSLKQLSPQK